MDLLSWLARRIPLRVQFGVPSTKASKWPKPTTKQPSIKTLEKWVYDIEMPKATDGCPIEPDGVCEHGHPSWLLVLGYI